MIKNASQLPQVYYGLHMVEGLAEYSEPQVNDGSPYRILVGENVLKVMNGTYSGKPVYVQHVNNVNIDKLQEEAAGYVVESFYNQADGKHWAKFIVVSDAGHEAIRKGWKLSNAYMPKEFSGGGRWHNVDYTKELMKGEYEHLAIVPNPRYEESIILTPEQFKAYNSEKEQELKAVANSKGERSMFKFFKKAKLENSEEFEQAVVTLSNGQDISIKQLINAMEDKMKEEEKVEAKEAKKDSAEEGKKEEEPKKEEPKAPMANGDHKVKVGEEEMTVNELVEKYQGLIEPKKEEPKKEDSAEPKKEEPGKEEKKDAVEPEGEKQEPKKEEKKQNAGHFDALKNAHNNAVDVVLDTSWDQVARGKSRYGSK